MPRRTRLRLGPDDWARCRFVRSTLFEVAQAVRVLFHSRSQRYQQPGLDTIDQSQARARRPVLGAVNPDRGWIPDFIAPPAQLGDRSVEDELALVAGYPIDLVAADLRRSLDSHLTQRRRAVLEPLIADPEAGRAAVVSELRWAWNTLIEPSWTSVNELISTDIAYRSREIARAGLGPALGDLHASVTWNEGSITVEPAHEAIDLDLAGQGLALMPSAFCWPGVILIYDQPWTPTLVYPARGIGDLWTVPAPPPARLAGVLGRTRALLIADLAAPSTTTALAARHQLSPASVSAQLIRLRDAGLVSSHRLGKEVHYQRTSLAEALIQAGAGRP